MKRKISPEEIQNYLDYMAEVAGEEITEAQAIAALRELEGHTHELAEVAQ